MVWVLSYYCCYLSKVMAFTAIMEVIKLDSIVIQVAIDIIDTHYIEVMDQAIDIATDKAQVALATINLQI